MRTNDIGAWIKLISIRIKVAINHNGCPILTLLLSFVISILRCRLHRALRYTMNIEHTLYKTV